MNIPKIEEAITLLYQTYIEDQDVATQRGVAIRAMNEMVKLLGGDDVVEKIEAVPYSARVRAQHLFEDAPQRKPLTDEEMFKIAEIAWRHGWASCRDAEYIGEEAEDERWGMVGAEVVQDIAAHGIKE